jgi:hypothetical protein
MKRLNEMHGGKNDRQHGVTKAQREFINLKKNHLVKNHKDYIFDMWYVTSSTKIVQIMPLGSKGPCQGGRGVSSVLYEVIQENRTKSACQNPQGIEL